MRARLAGALRHPIARNALSLYAVQALVLLFPLLLLPYLARVLGPRELGVVLFAQSSAFVLGVLIEYGFDLSASRRIARVRDDRGAVADVVGGVLGAKVVLAALACVVALVAWPFVPLFRERPELLALAVALTLVQGFHPLWYFLGTERLGTTALLELLARSLLAAAVVLFVRDEGDALPALAAYVLAAVVATGGGSLVMARQLPLRRPTRAGARAALRDGFALFVGRSGTTLSTSATVVVVGLVLPTAQVAFFAAAERVVRVSTRMLSQLGAATYPRVHHLHASGAQARAADLARLTLLLLAGAAVVGAVLLVALATPVVRVLFGPEFGPAVEVLRILAVVLPLATVSGALSTHWLLVHGMDRAATRVVLAAGAAQVAAVALLAGATGIDGAAWAVVGAELAAAGAYLTLVLRAGMALTSRPGAGAAGRPPAA